MKPEEETEEKEPTCWDYLSLPRLIFFTIVVVYLLFGATVLHVLEREDDDDNGESVATKLEQKSAKVDLTKVVEQLWDDAQNEDISEEEWKSVTKTKIEQIDDDDDDDEDGEFSWTFAQCFMYTTASLTRIGSTVQPETFLGRLFILIYTFFGVPLLLIFFADLGKIFVNVLQIAVEHMQRRFKTGLLRSISTPTGDIDNTAFILTVTVLLSGYVAAMSMFFRLWCGGSVFGNIYNAFLIVFGVGPAPIGGTEKCIDVGVFSIVPAFLMAISAPIAWSLTNMQTDTLGTEYIRNLHRILRKFKRE